MFHNGKLEYTTRLIHNPYEFELNIDEWDDGYVAFSNNEIRKNTLPHNYSIKELLSKKIENVPDLEGYLTEIDLWKNRENIYEEISIERTTNGFFMHKWVLTTDVQDDQSANCFYKIVTPYFDGNEKIFKDGNLGMIEVIYPEHRLSIFMSTT